MSSRVLPEFWLRCDFGAMEACWAWPRREPRRLEVEGADEYVAEVDVEAKRVRVQEDHLCWNREREPPPLFGRKRKARKRHHRRLSGPGESKKGRHHV